MARAVYDFQSPNRRTAIGKSHEAVSREIMQFDDAMFEFKLDVMIRTKVEDVAGPQRTGVRGPEGVARHGVPGIRPGEGGVRRRRDGVQEAEGRGEPPARGDRRDGHVPAAGVPGRAPRTHPRE